MSVCVYPCTCGYHGDSLKPFTSAPTVVTKYQKRISGPILGRIDIHIEVPRVDYEKLSGDRLGGTSVSIRARVQKAHDIRLTQFSKIESLNIARMPVCAWGRSSSYASWRTKVSA